MTVEGGDLSRLDLANWDELAVASEEERRSSMLTWHAEDVVEAFLAGIGELRWSPNSEQLAVVAAIDGPSGDAYVLDADDWSILRVSDEPSHVIRLSWSPDGRWLLHEGAYASSRASGSALGTNTTLSSVDGVSQLWLWSGSGIGAWPSAWPDTWLGDDTAIVHSEGHGCGLCSVLRIDASSATTQTLASGMEGSSLDLDPTSRTAAIAATFYPSGGVESEGIHLLDLDGLGRETVSELRCDVALWAAEELPYVWLPSHRNETCTSVAFGQGGRLLNIDNPEGFRQVSVSPTGAWRILYGEAGWRVFDRRSVERGVQVASEATSEGEAAWLAVDEVVWHPNGERLYWKAGDQLWTSAMPDGVPQFIGDWPGSRPGWLHLSGDES
jgi:hypothetical protein